MKEITEAKGSNILIVKDEKEFYSLIEERMQKKGFEVFNTSPLVLRDNDWIRFF